MKDTAGTIKGRSDVGKTRRTNLDARRRKRSGNTQRRGHGGKEKRVRDLRADLVRRAREEPSNGRTEKRDENLKEIIAKVVLRFPNSWSQTIHPQIRRIRQARSVRMWPGDRPQR